MICIIFGCTVRAVEIISLGNRLSRWLAETHVTLLELHFLRKLLRVTLAGFMDSTTVDRVGSHVGGSLFKGSPTKILGVVDEYNGAYQLEVRPKFAVRCFPCSSIRSTLSLNAAQRSAPTIPTAYETVILQGKRERSAFGTRGARLPVHRVSCVQRCKQAKGEHNFCAACALTWTWTIL